MKWNLILIPAITILLSGCDFHAGAGLNIDPPEEQKTSYSE